MNERYDFPWFSFYPADWFSSAHVKIMTLQEKGAYIELLLYAWKSDACALPKDEGLLQRLVSWPLPEYPGDGAEDMNHFGRVMDCFEPHPDKPDMITNRRLYKEWLAAIERHRLFVQRGKKGAKKRWSQATQPSTPIPPPIRPPTNLKDRSNTGFESIGQIADKHFKPK